VFYSAYATLSARNVDNNSLIRDGLRRGDADAWLERL